MERRGINDEVAAAMRYAREECGMTPEQFARELNRLAPGQDPLGANDVEAFERGAEVLAVFLVAAARIVAQPVSVVLGELDLYTASIPALEKRIGELETVLEQAGLRRRK